MDKFSLLVVGSKTIKSWNLGTGKLRMVTGVFSLCISPDINIMCSDDFIHPLSSSRTGELGKHTCIGAFKQC